MEKIWYIEIDGKKEGPYSVKDLKRHRRLTPDTLAWKQGFATWVSIRHIPELKEVFEDQEPKSEDDEEEASKTATKQVTDELALDWRVDPPQFYFWMLVALILIALLLFHLQSSR